MGNQCSLDQLNGCFEQFANRLTLGSAEEKDDSSELLGAKLATLKVGGRFLRSRMFGLSSVEVQVVLSEDNTMLKWHNVATGGWLSSNEKGVVDLTQVTDVRSENEQSLVLTDSNQTELFNVQAETRGVRDKWVSLLTELLESWSEQLERPAAKLTADGTSDKAEYFRKRNEEVEERAKQRAEMKAKYSGGGMKYSAMALARRGDDS